MPGGEPLWRTPVVNRTKFGRYFPIVPAGNSSFRFARIPKLISQATRHFGIFCKILTADFNPTPKTLF